MTFTENYRSFFTNSFINKKRGKPVSFCALHFGAVRVFERWFSRGETQALLDSSEEAFDGEALVGSIGVDV